MSNQDERLEKLRQDRYDIMPLKGLELALKQCEKGLKADAADSDVDKNRGKSAQARRAEAAAAK